MTVNGLLFGLVALGLAAIGKTLFLKALRANDSHIDVPGQLTWNTVVRILVSLAFVATLAWAMVVENTLSAIESFVRVNPLYVVLNLTLVFGCLNFGSMTTRRLYQESRIEYKRNADNSSCSRVLPARCVSWQHEEATRHLSK